MSRRPCRNDVRVGDRKRQNPRVPSACTTKSSDGSRTTVYVSSQPGDAHRRLDRVFISAGLDDSVSLFAGGKSPSRLGRPTILAANGPAFHADEGQLAPRLTGPSHDVCRGRWRDGKTWRYDAEAPAPSNRAQNHIYHHRGQRRCICGCWIIPASISAPNRRRTAGPLNRLISAAFSCLPPCRPITRRQLNVCTTTPFQMERHAGDDNWDGTERRL